MIVNDRITDYIQSLEVSQGPVLETIEQEALDGFVPIIRRETAAFLRTMTAALRPKAILEIDQGNQNIPRPGGTAHGGNGPSGGGVGDILCEIKRLKNLPSSAILDSQKTGKTLRNEETPAADSRGN